MRANVNEFAICSGGAKFFCLPGQMSVVLPLQLATPILIVLNNLIKKINC